jgi:putative hydrolase of the HAD superfamily
VLPRAVLLDLDDTILDDTGGVEGCWREACEHHAARLTPLEPPAVVDIIRKTSSWFWSDPERHRAGRLDLRVARREVVRLALLEMGIEEPDLASGIGDAYTDRRDAGMQAFPDAIDTVRWLRTSGCRLALVTNGAGPAQRKKIARFGLAGLFDTILVEGELGFGKPDERVYRRALDDLGVQASQAWMIGDNLEWDVAAPQKLGVFGIWIDAAARGLPDTTGIRPNRVVRSLAEVRLGTR